MKIPDKELLQRIKHNEDESAFRILHDRYWVKLYNHIYYKAIDKFAPQDAESIAKDVVQDTFLRVWQKRKAIKPNRSFLAWTLTISQNLYIDIIKRKPPEPPSEDETDLDTKLDEEMLRDRIIAIVNKFLPKRCGEILILRYIDELQNDEIAALLKLSKRTVENQLLKALKIIRKKLGTT